jgi:type II secretory pathway pseudopilin PulG
LFPFKKIGIFKKFGVEMKMTARKNGELRTPDKLASRHKKFTLVELLIVVSIIIILISLLLPGLRLAKEKSKQIACLGNLRQIGVALSAYAGDSSGWLPVSYGVANWDNRIRDNNVWTGLGLLYADNYLGNGGVLYCPNYQKDSSKEYLYLPNEPYKNMFSTYDYYLANKNYCPSEMKIGKALEENVPAALDGLYAAYLTRNTPPHRSGFNILLFSGSALQISDPTGGIDTSIVSDSYGHITDSDYHNIMDYAK